MWWTGGWGGGGGWIRRERGLDQGGRGWGGWRGGGGGVKWLDWGEGWINMVGWGWGGEVVGSGRRGGG